MNMNYDNMSDEEVVAIAQAGQESAAEHILRKYKNMANQVARRFYIAGAEQEDITQEGMIGLYKAILKYRMDKTKFSTFAYQCIRRSILDALRSSLSGKHAALNNYKPISDVEAVLTSEEDLPEHIILREEQIELLWKQLSEILSAKEYLVFQHYIGGLSISEIADKVGVNYKSCDNTLQRIRNKIAKL